MFNFVNVFSDAAAEVKNALSIGTDKAISSICESQKISGESHNGSVKEVVVYYALKVEQEVDDILGLFYKMADQSKPSMFTELWEDARKNYLMDCERNKVKPSLTLPQVVTQIWAPVFEECNQIVEELSSLAMPLTKMKKYLFPKEKKKLEESLWNLCYVVDACRSLNGKEKIGQEWVREAVDRMLKYYTLCKYADAAEILGKLKEVLNLKGDFSLVKTLSEQVCDIFYLRFLYKYLVSFFQVSKNVSEEITLKTVDETVVETGDVLKDIADDPGRQICLDTFCNCMDLVYWLQNETTSVLFICLLVIIVLCTFNIYL